MTEWSLIVVAGGSGRRLGGAPKQFRLLEGRPVWRWSADVGAHLVRKGLVSEIVLVVPQGRNQVCDEAFCQGEPVPVRIVEGGKERVLSVLNGLRAARAERALVHDAARPFLSEDLCLRLMQACSADVGAVPLTPVSDAVKEVEGDRILPYDRDRLRLTQTPQAFPRQLLCRCIEEHGEGCRDEAEAWIRSDRKLNAVLGDRWNFKITDASDWEVARMMAGAKTDREIRTGMGFDVHPLVPGRRLILGGVPVDGAPLGLDGHSDADLVCHSVADALLGAAGEPDIGRIFPASDPSFRNVSSLGLLKQVAQRVRSRGWEVVWVDVVLHAQVPRLGALVPSIIASLSQALEGVDDVIKVNLKVKSGERVGAVGSAQAMQCYAVATLERYQEGR